MSPESDSTQALSVLRDIWHAQERTSADLEGLLGHAKSCKAMAHIGNAPVDDDLRTAWRDKLSREGKLSGESLRDLVFDQSAR